MADRKQTIIDYGHYTEIPVPEGEGVLAVGEGETFKEVFVIRPGGRQSLPFDKIVAMRGSQIEICIIVMPGVDIELPLYLDLAGEGAHVSLSGAYICGGNEKVTFRTDVRHRAGGCVSNQLFNGIASGTAHAGFYGRIVVAPGAQKTEAFQSNHNILVSQTAKVDTKPQLEIYADDVKCSHGATIGSLNPDEQFYMRSRGISEREAKVLQMISFIAPVLSHISDESRREEIAAEVEENIRAIAR